MDISAQIREALLDFPSVQLAILFGSRAKGKARSSSDIDLAVSMSTGPMLASEKAAVMESLALKTGCSVDLVDFATVSEPLLGQIMQGGSRLIGKEAQHARWMARHWIENADFSPYQQRILTERRTAWIGK